MKLSDIKGEKALDILADAMGLAEIVADDERVKAMMDDLREQEENAARARVVFKHLPAIMKDERYKTRIVSIMAAAAGVPYEEYAEDGPMVADLLELLTSDAETLGFLIGSSARGE